MNREQLMSVLIAPHVTEKTSLAMQNNNSYAFRVLRESTKPEVKAAVEMLFKVEVDSVQIANVKGKPKRFGAYAGRRRNWKKAYVCLKPGQEINFAQEP